MENLNAELALANKTPRIFGVVSKNHLKLIIIYQNTDKKSPLKAGGFFFGLTGKIIRNR